MFIESNRVKHVRQYCVRLLNREVFAHLRFLTKEQRDIVYDSYVQNIDTLIEYAVENNLNVDNYIKEIKTILLKAKNVREYMR
jgi:hypothetical protein